MRILAENQVKKGTIKNKNVERPKGRGIKPWPASFLGGLVCLWRD